MNRYDNGSVAKFSPLSFQELSAAPLMQRQKHDQLIAQQEMLRQNLAKTNPHEKYFDEAVRLKDELNNQINTQAELLAKEGVNPNSQSEFLKLNRNYQETMSPTGKLGMINAHNVNLQSTYKNYIDEAIKAGQSPAIAKLHADQAIQKHMKEPLYDERGRVVDFSAGNAAPKYIDNVKWINELASKVGFTQSNWAQASSGISKTADGRFVVNESAKGMTKDNIENLNRLAQAANREVSDPASEIRQNIDYNFKNPQTELDNMLNQLYARRERESGVTDRSKSYGSVDWNKMEDVNGGVVPDSIPEKVITINDNETLLKSLTSSAPINPSKETYVPLSVQSMPGYKTTPQKLTKEQIKESPEYIDLATKIKNQSPSLRGLKTNDEKVVNATIDYLKKHRNTQTINRIITPSTSKDTRGYSADEIAKYTKTKQDAMETAIRNGMKVYDENGDEIKNPKSKSIIYNGEYTFNSVTPIKSTNPKTRFSPISATMIDENGEEKKVYVAQNPDREKDPLFKAQYTAFQTLDKANKYRGLKQPLKNTFTEENLGLRDVNVTYNDDGSVILEGKHYNGKNWEEMPKQIYGNDSDFVNYIHNLYK